jgi:hypothetical protein
MTLSPPTIAAALYVAADTARLLGQAVPGLELTVSVSQRPAAVDFHVHRVPLGHLRQAADQLAIPLTVRPSPAGVWLGGATVRDSVRIALIAEYAGRDAAAARERYPAGKAGF